MAKELPKIKPCPWCKGRNAESVVKFYGHEFRVSCNDYECDAVGPTKETKVGAIEAWNRAPREGE